MMLMGIYFMRISEEKNKLKPTPLQVTYSQGCDLHPAYLAPLE